MKKELIKECKNCKISGCNGKHRLIGNGDYYLCECECHKPIKDWGHIIYNAENEYEAIQLFNEAMKQEKEEAEFELDKLQEMTYRNDERQKLIKKIEKINVSGGGNGRRVKEQILSILKNEEVH